MARYHINPNTGNPGVCRAKNLCPFGDSSNHFDSKNEALLVYEKKMSGFTQAQNLSPIQGCLDPLGVAKKVDKERVEFFSLLSGEEATALDVYAMGSHEYINGHLRGEEVPPWAYESAIKRIAIFDSVFERVKPKDRVTYKYISASRLLQGGKLTDEVSIGKALQELSQEGNFTSREFVSTSSMVDYPLYVMKNPKKDSQFKKDLILLEIASNKGIPLQPDEVPQAGDIQSLETEILLPRNSNFHVANIDPKRRVSMGPMKDILLQDSYGKNNWQLQDASKLLDRQKYFRVPTVRLEQQ